MGQSLDEIDRHILFYLARDARRTSAPDIAEDLDVSSATIRNRIKKLEDSGIIRGYHADIDYEKTDGKLTHLYICTADPHRREDFLREALETPGVIHVREVMSGRRNLHITAIGEDKTDIAQISIQLSNVGIEIEEVDILQRDIHNPYQLFGPESDQATPYTDLTNSLPLSGDAEIMNIPVAEDAVANEVTIQDLSEKDLLRDECRIVAIKRGGERIMPSGETLIQEGDMVTILSRQGHSSGLVEVFTGETDDTHSEPGDANIQ